MSKQRPSPVRRNWITTGMFVATLAIAAIGVPWYGRQHGYHAAIWVWFALILGANGMAITCGYHRLFAHRSYQAHPVLKIAYLLFGAMALQNSCLIWAASHRVHHRFIDEPERDPYCAKLGFWFSHIGWMLRHYPSGIPDFRVVKDLQRDPLVKFQHDFYLPLALLMNFGLPAIVGWICGDVVGGLLVVGFLRLVVSHHVTFFINSLAHIWGSQPYTEDNTARDNGVVALLTYGEGYHNFHHLFAEDYRNGVRAWQWDPSKWFIAAMSWAGLATHLKRVPWFKIQRALLDAQFSRAERQLANQSGPAQTVPLQIEALKSRLAEEYDVFSRAVADWTHLREQWLLDAKRAVLERWERSLLQSRLQELELKLKIQYRRMRVLDAQIAFTVA